MRFMGRHIFVYISYNILYTFYKIYIKINDQSLNKSDDKYYLSHIWDELLFITPELKMEHPDSHSGHSSCHILGIQSGIPFNKFCITSQKKLQLSTTMSTTADMPKTVAFHLPYMYIFLFNVSEQSRTCTTLEPSSVPLNHEVHFL